MKRKILVLELWGLGDLTFSTLLIKGALKAGDEVHLVGKGHARPLLEPTFPSVRFIPFEAGWTKFHNKYHFWHWNWRAFFALLRQLRKERYDVAVSVRDDPRDHLLMALIGARERYGFAHRGSGMFLTHPVRRTHDAFQHKVEDWRDLGAAMGIPGMEEAQPRLRHAAYRSSRIEALFEGLTRPVLVLHAGARIDIRRWPVAYFQELILRLRTAFDFHLILIPDPDGYGSPLSPLADTVLHDLSLAELTDVIGRASLLLCNDSGPAHLAAVCERPTLALFGPTQVNWFRPWGEIHHPILRDICPHRPCFDYCRFPEPYCMTRLRPETVWPEVDAQIRRLAAQGLLPAGIIKPPSPATPFVAVIVATCRRPRELARLLASLEATATPLGVVVVDNADDPATAAAVQAASQRLEIHRLAPGKNLGCGGGLALGERAALKRFGERVTHLWILDDDAVPTPGALEKLLAALEREKASVACPMVLDEAGQIGWFPGLRERKIFDALRKGRVRTPDQYLEEFGEMPVAFSWAPGVSLLVERGAFEATGPHREDFLIRGEDLDFSLRLTALGKGIYVPTARVSHLPPAAVADPKARAEERKKHALLLQNLAYISLRLPHGRRILHTLPGNFWRYLRTWGPVALGEGLAAYLRGGILGHPAGRKAFAPQKLLVFAHTPPPHHGQSFMVQLMLQGFGGDVRAEPHRPGGGIACYHVNCRVSNDMEDIGSMRWGKVFQLLSYCSEAIWCRIRHGVHTLYYVPAPGKRNALFRDWIVMALCRPFFKRLVFHWHASGLSDWLETKGHPLERQITRLLLGRPSLSIALAGASSRDAAWLRSRQVAVVPNGLPDPCPEFEREILPCRTARTRERQLRLKEPARADAAPLIFRVLYMAHCTREKGIFDALEGVALFNQRALGCRVHFSVAGSFMDTQEEREFRERIGRPDLAGAVAHLGFVSGEKKKSLFVESDCICFPTYYPAESFPLTLVEAAAYGLPSVVTRWRAIPEIQPPDYPGFVEPRAPGEIADALERLAVADMAEPLRARFIAQFSLASHLAQMAQALRRAEAQG